VQIVTGYAEAGNALVTSGVDKLIFVGSTEIGKKVMQAAAQNLTPVVLELGGKDAFIVCDDANLSEVCHACCALPHHTRLISEQPSQSWPAQQEASRILFHPSSAC